MSGKVVPLANGRVGGGKRLLKSHPAMVQLRWSATPLVHLLHLLQL